MVLNTFATIRKSVELKGLKYYTCLKASPCEKKSNAEEHLGRCSFAAMDDNQPITIT